MSIFNPTWYYKSILDIPFEKLQKQGISTILFDLDNTLVPYYCEVPNEAATIIVNKLKQLNMTVYVISNNNIDRVDKFCKSLEIEYLYKSKKPFKKRCKKFLAKHNQEKSKIVLVGDQLLTDIVMANKLKIKSILVEPASEKDLLITRLNRKIDKKIRKKLFKKNLLEGVEE